VLNRSDTSKQTKCLGAAFPEKETPELKETHWRANAGFVVGLEIEVDPVTAEIINVIWKKRK
jgi:hypothetical protein